MVTATADQKIIAPQKGKQTKFVSCSADICFYGGARGGGKTAGEIIDTCRYVDNPNYRAVIFRRTSPQIRKSGGLLDATRKIYPLIGGKLNLSELYWTFPSGARVELAHLQYDKDIENWQGLEITGIYFDEVCHFTEKQFWGVSESNRSTSGISPYVRGTCNPDASSFVAEFISWWIDSATGLPIEERNGVIRHVMRVEDELEWYDDPQHDDEGEQLTQSVTFISATIYDNPILMKANPGYLRKLQSMPPYRREVMLHGNWLAVDDSDTEWPSSLFENAWVDTVPQCYGERLRVLSIDPSKGGQDKKHDYTAFVYGDLREVGQHDYFEAELHKINPTLIVEKLFELCGDGPDQWQPDVIALEAVQFQDIIAELVVAKAHEFEGTWLHRWLQNNNFMLLSHTQPKIHRIRRDLSNVIGSGKIKFVRGRHGTKLMVQHIRQFPKSFRDSTLHDDGADAAAATYEAAKIYLGGSV